MKNAQSETEVKREKGSDKGEPDNKIEGKRKRKTVRKQWVNLDWRTRSDIG